MIISASRRTDIPAFHWKWFMDSVREGCCQVANPFNSKQVSKVSLLPEDFDAIVFWTKNPAPMMADLDELETRGLRFYVQFTLNDYPAQLEPHLPALPARIATFKKLSDRIGPDRVIWRYDPIIISNKTGYDYHRQSFADLCTALASHTRRVVISIVDYYAKTKKAFAGLEGEGFEFPPDPVDSPDMDELLGDLSRIAHSVRFEIQTCAEKRDYSSLGIAPGKCIDGDLIEQLWHRGRTWKKDPHQRENCGCAESKDIGTNGTCLYDCVYCYAAGRRKVVQ